MEESIEECLEEECLAATDPRYAQPRVFEGRSSAPMGFDAVTIYLEGGTQADLDWKKARQQARKAVEQGYALMWDIQLGLFQQLAHPLINQTQFLSLTLSLEHFRDSLWQEFKSHTIGLSLFRGSADFSQGFLWDSHQEHNLKEWLQESGKTTLSALDLNQIIQSADGQELVRIFCRDVAIEYCTLLASRLPDTLPLYLYLDATAFSSSPLSQLQLLNPERFERFHLALQGQTLPFRAWGWRVPTGYGYSGDHLQPLPPLQMPTIGVCVPPMSLYSSQHYRGLEEGICALQTRRLPFKLIAEHQLTSQWDGLDFLFYTPSGLSVQGKRKLQGFCAAGGTAVSTTHHLMGLSCEVSLTDWLASS